MTCFGLVSCKNGMLLIQCSATITTSIDTVIIRVLHTTRFWFTIATAVPDGNYHNIGYGDLDTRRRATDDRFHYPGLLRGMNNPYTNYRLLAKKCELIALTRVSTGLTQ